jgi:hypothetical protein
MPDRPFLQAWYNQSIKEGEILDPLLKPALTRLRDAVNGNWDFRETFYRFCIIAIIQAHPQALVDHYMTRKQAPGEAPNAFIMAMATVSQAIEQELGEEKKVLEIAIKNLIEEQLRSHLQEAMEEGKVKNFQVALC